MHFVRKARNFHANTSESNEMSNTACFSRKRRKQEDEGSRIASGTV